MNMLLRGVWFTPKEGRAQVENRCLRFGGCFVVSLVVMLFMVFCAYAAEEVCVNGDTKNPVLKGRTRVACTEVEQARLQKTWQKGQGRSYEVLNRMLRRADVFLNDPVEFPSRGGQHGSWYYCDDCEIGLETIDPTHHRCPQCKKIYSGNPYDDVLFSRRHYRNLKNMADAAWVYTFTGEKKYAEYAAKVLLGYARRYRDYPYHSASLQVDRSWGKVSGGHLFEQTLNEASGMSQEIAPAYDLIYDSGILSQADHEAIRSGLILPMLENIGKNRARKSNWQSWHNAAMLWGGAVLNDQTWVDRSIRDPENGFYYQMENSVSQDGMWYENSWDYHFYTLAALVQQVEGARRLGIDLWSHPMIQKMFTMPVSYSMADGKLPRFGDAVNASAGGPMRQIEAAFAVYRDPRMITFLREEPRFESILLGRHDQDGKVSEEVQALESVLDNRSGTGIHFAGSEVFRSSGHAILRIGGKAGQTAAITFSPYGGGHGHYDKLSFVYYAYGQEFGVDPGRARQQAYRLPVHKKWYKGTISHNTVLVDRQTQEAAQGQPEMFQANDHYAAVIARCTQGYEGVSHERLLLMTEEYLLVLDTLKSDQPRQYDWLYHNRGKVISCCPVKNETPFDKESYSGGEYLQVAGSGGCDDVIRVVFQTKGIQTYLTMAGQANSKIMWGDGPGESVLDRIPLVMVGREGKEISFVGVLEPVREGKEPRVKSIERSPDSTTRSGWIQINQAGHVDRVTIDAQEGLVFQRDGETLLSGQWE